MELVTMSLELAKEAMKEAAKETVKTVEGVIGLGKIGNEVSTEHISLGKVDTDDCSKQINFGSLASGAFKRNKNYLRWKDGINVGEIKKGWIEELTNEISAIFGDDNLQAITKYIKSDEDGTFHRFDNAGMRYYVGQLVYDPKYLRVNGNKYGMDNILGTLAHEVGHRVVHNIGLGEEITPYENEACADYICGLTTRLCKLNASHKLAWYNDGPEITIDDEHPGRSVRMETFIRGFDRIDRGEEATALRVFEAFSPYDFEGTYQNADLLKNILYEDVIIPLRNGEIKKV